MSDLTTPVAVFGDQEADLWGLFIGGEHPFLSIGSLTRADSSTRAAGAVLDRDDDQIWTVAGGGHELRLEKALASTATPDEHSPLQPVRVTGAVQVGTEELEVDVAGVISEVPLDKGFGSLRLVGAWFPAGHQISLLAQRPKGAKGHDKDAISVVALGEQATMVFDPRFSTTYGPEGDPRRTGIELWLGASEEEDQYPRRMSGMATGAAVTDSLPGFSFGAHALRCLSRGETGAGVYVLIQAS